MRSGPDDWSGCLSTFIELKAHIVTQTVILLRCTKVDSRVLEQRDLLRESLPDFRIVAIPDLINETDLSGSQRFESADLECFPLTKSYLEKAGLSEAESKTGWVCGDYVFCRALEFDWDYAWIVEPDIFFLNGSENLISRLEELDHDLLGTFLRAGIPQWHWYAPLHQLDLGMDIHAMAFPFVRMSRRLAEDVFETRKKISAKIEPSQKMPNDESVVATVAHSGSYSVLDLERLFTDVFKYWSSVTRHNVDDIAAADTDSRIVHSGYRAEPFNRYLSAQLELAMKGHQLPKDRILKCLKSSSRQTVERFLAEVMDKLG